MRGDCTSESAENDDLVSSMTAYQAGRLAGFEALYAALAGDLERFFASAQGRGAAKDLVQETFLEIHRSRRTYLPPRPVRPWVFGLARNVLRRHRRAAWRRARHESALAGASLHAQAARSSAVNGVALDARDVDDALSHLPVARREAWMLHHVYGWSFPEIATRLRIGVDAAKLRSSRAMRSLRSALGVEPLPTQRRNRKRSGDDGEGGPLG